MSLFLAYLSVAAALLSGFTALATNRCHGVAALANKLFQAWPATQTRVNWMLAEERYAEFHRNSIFLLLGIAGASALLAGIWALLTATVLVDTLPFGLRADLALRAGIARPAQGSATDSWTGP